MIARPYDIKRAAISNRTNHGLKQKAQRKIRTPCAKQGAKTFVNRQIQRYQIVPHQRQAIALSVIAFVLSLSSINTVAQQSPPLFDQLDNGLRIVLIEDRALPLVSVQLWYQTGATANPPTKSGMCTVACDVLANHNDAAQQIRAAGMIHKHGALEDASYFHEIGPSHALDALLDIQKKRLIATDFTDADTQQAITAACATRRDQTTAEAELRRALFGDHPYATPPGTIASDFEQTTPAEIREFITKWFVPANARLIIYGDISPITVREACRKRFADVKWREAPEFYVPRPDQLNKDVTIQNSAGHCGAMLAWRCDPYGSFDNAALAVFLEYLRQPVDGEETAAAMPARLAHVNFDIHPLRRAGYCTLGLSHGDSMCKDAKRCNDKWFEIGLALVEESLDAPSNPPDLRRLRRARATVQARHRDEESVFATRALSFGCSEAIAGDALLATLQAESTAGVRALEFQAAAKSFSETSMVELRTLPHNKELAAKNHGSTPRHESLAAVKGDDSRRPKVKNTLGRRHEFRNWTARNGRIRITALKMSTPDVAIHLSGILPSTNTRTFSDYCALNAMSLDFGSNNDQSFSIRCFPADCTSAIERSLRFLQVRKTEPNFRMTVVGPIEPDTIAPVFADTLGLRIEQYSQEPAPIEVSPWCQLQSALQIAQHLHSDKVIPWLKN